MLQRRDSTATCKVCAQVYTPRNTMQVVCSPRCAVKHAKSKAKEDREFLRQRLEAIKPRSKWMAEAQSAFNAYIRERDAHLPCVSCGRFHDGQWHAGHYLTVGARPELRFDGANVHRQCQPCNTHLHGNLVLYRLELIRRIGLDGVERLEGPATPRKYSVDDLRTIRDTYRAKARELRRRREQEY